MPSFSAAITSVDDDEDEPQTVHIKKKPQNDVLQIKKPVIAPKPISLNRSKEKTTILKQVYEELYIGLFLMPMNEQVLARYGG